MVARKARAAAYNDAMKITKAVCEASSAELLQHDFGRLMDSLAAGHVSSSSSSGSSSTGGWRDGSGTHVPPDAVRVTLMSSNGTTGDELAVYQQLRKYLTAKGAYVAVLEWLHLSQGVGHVCQQLLEQWAGLKTNAHDVQALVAWYHSVTGVSATEDDGGTSIAGTSGASAAGQAAPGAASAGAHPAVQSVTQAGGGASGSGGPQADMAVSTGGGTAVQPLGAGTDVGAATSSAEAGVDAGTSTATGRLLRARRSNLQSAVKSKQAATADAASDAAIAAARRNRQRPLCVLVRGAEQVAANDLRDVIAALHTERACLPVQLVLGLCSPPALFTARLPASVHRLMVCQHLNIMSLQRQVARIFGDVFLGSAPPALLPGPASLAVLLRHFGEGGGTPVLDGLQLALLLHCRQEPLSGLAGPMAREGRQAVEAAAEQLPLAILAAAAAELHDSLQEPRPLSSTHSTVAVPDADKTNKSRGRLAANTGISGGAQAEVEQQQRRAVVDAVCAAAVSLSRWRLGIMLLQAVAEVTGAHEQYNAVELYKAAVQSQAEPITRVTTRLCGSTMERYSLRRLAGHEQEGQLAALVDDCLTCVTDVQKVWPGDDLETIAAQLAGLQLPPSPLQQPLPDGRPAEQAGPEGLKSSDCPSALPAVLLTLADVPPAAVDVPPAQLAVAAAAVSQVAASAAGSRRQAAQAAVMSPQGAGTIAAAAAAGGSTSHLASPITRQLASATLQSPSGSALLARNLSRQVHVSSPALLMPVAKKVAKLAPGATDNSKAGRNQRLLAAINEVATSNPQAAAAATSAAGGSAAAAAAAGQQAASLAWRTADVLGAAVARLMKHRPFDMPGSRASVLRDATGLQSRLVGQQRCAIYTALTQPRSYLPAPPSLAAAVAEAGAEGAVGHVSPEDAGMLFQSLMGHRESLAMTDWFNDFRQIASLEDTADCPPGAVASDVDDPAAPSKQRGKRAAEQLRNPGEGSLVRAGSTSAAAASAAGVSLPTPRSNTAEVQYRQLAARFSQAVADLQYVGLCRPSKRRRGGDMLVQRTFFPPEPTYV